MREKRPFERWDLGMVWFEGSKRLILIKHVLQGEKNVVFAELGNSCVHIRTLLLNSRSRTRIFHTQIKDYRLYYYEISKYLRRVTS